MRRFLLGIFILLALAGLVSGIEIVRQKNVATYIFFPIIDADGDIVTSAAALDSETDTFADGVVPNGFSDLTNEATEIGTDGWYYISLTQAEMNFDYIAIQIKTSTSGAKTQHILIRTIVGDPLNLATTDDGGTINVTGGGIDWNASWDAEVESEVEDAVGGDVTSILTDTGTTLNDLVDDLEGRLTATRAGYLDNLSGGAVALDAGVDVTKIHGSALNETNAGDIADSFGFFFNVDPITTKTVNDVGAPAAGGGSPLALASGNLGDYKSDLTVYFLWRTVDQGGAAANPTSAGTIKVYKADGTTEITAPTGITDTRGFDGITGIHLCAIDLSASAFYDIKQDYSVVLTGATIDSQSVTCVIATFGIENRFSEPQFIYGSLDNLPFYAFLTETENVR